MIMSVQAVVGTSCAMICLTSFIGFVRWMMYGSVAWQLAMMVSIVSVMSAFLGRICAGFLNMYDWGKDITVWASVVGNTIALVMMLALGYKEWCKALRPDA